MAEYYEWLTPEHSEFGLKKKTHAFFRNIDDDYFETSSVSIEFLEDLNAIRHSKKNNINRYSTLKIHRNRN